MGCVKPLQWTSWLVNSSWMRKGCSQSHWRQAEAEPEAQVSLKAHSICRSRDNAGRQHSIILSKLVGWWFCCRWCQQVLCSVSLYLKCCWYAPKWFFGSGILTLSAKSHWQLFHAVCVEEGCRWRCLSERVEICFFAFWQLALSHSWHVLCNVSLYLQCCLWTYRGMFALEFICSVCWQKGQLFHTVWTKSIVDFAQLKRLSCFIFLYSHS